MANILEPEYQNSVPPSIIVFDLNDDSIVRRYELPQDQFVQNKSLFANIAIEDNDCSRIFAYLADISSPGLVVYSWKDNDSWLVNHNYFNIDPLAGEFNVSGIVFHWSDGIFGMGLSEIKPDGSSDLYFHPMTSTDEFVVSTKFLKDKALSQKSNGEFRHLGSRGPKGQSSVSFLDKKTGVLFYALINLNAIACWKTTNPRYTMQSQGRVYMSNVTMVFPSDIKVDSDDNMWVLSNRLPTFMYKGFNASEVNFRLLTAPVKDAINGTACDAKGIVTPEMKAKMKNHLDSINPPKSTPKAGQSGSEGINSRLNAVLILLAVLNLLMMH
ncbi:protein yellow [Agrilus planipennis]|uniref:Protein yellow n=1 Tax=Agrilus planipennis TaxID=224129 RepID=A0A1W4XQF2_AGRPL|nr:protein yellow [Agrilus planipennis]